MFTWLRNKEKNITSTAIAMFVGSWLLLICQTCFAMPQDAVSIDLSQGYTEYSCHTADNEPEKLVEHNTDNDHCLGACDCDAVTASLNTIEKTSQSDKFHKVFLDSVPASISFKNKIASNLTHHSVPIPERAILLPLQRYPALLI